MQTVPAERFEEAVKRFALTVDLADRARREWVKLRRPALARGGTTGKVLGPHPLIEVIRTAERDAAKFGAALGLDLKSHRALGSLRGRPQERVPMRPAGGEPPKVVPIRRGHT